jgi:lycopene cyclase domain-containing protein
MSAQHKRNVEPHSRRMDKHYTYLVIDAATIFFPLLLSFDKKVGFYKLWQHLWKGMLLTGAFFIVWDVMFTRNGVWSFNDDYIMGFKIAGLPIEELLFFVVVPYACAFIYECLLCYFPFRQKPDKGWRIMLVLEFILLIAGAAFYEKAYTFYTFIFCVLAIFMLYLFRNKNSFRADVFLLGYLISIVPFFIVNGLLTAIPVVIYNNAENLGIRLYTIPFEDVFYGMLLMLGNIGIMEWRRMNVKGKM